jgi:hypothetical protein
MEYAFLHKIFTTTYLDSAGRPVFRPNENNSTAVWHKPVPKYSGWYFLNYRFAANEENMKALALAQHIEPEASPRDVRFEEAQRTSEADMYTDRMTVEERSFSKKSMVKVRARAMEAMVEKLRAKYGAESMRNIVEAVAKLFDVSVSMVRRVCEPPAPVKAKVSQEYKEDERWKHLRWAVSQARASAYLTDTYSRPGTVKAYGKFEPVDALISYRGQRLYPEACIVLGLPLSYDRFDVAGGVEGAKGAVARIGRLDTTKPFEAGNIMLMSTLASRLIEGLADQATLSDDFGKRWLAWCDTHNVEPLRQRAKGGRPKGARSRPKTRA